LVAFALGAEAGAMASLDWAHALDASDTQTTTPSAFNICIAFMTSPLV
jgi:hypothetical protein